MKIIILYVTMFSALYHNWTSIGIDNEHRALVNIRNSQGPLIKIGVTE